MSLAAQELIEADSSKAAAAFWCHVCELEYEYVFRVASFICAKTTDHNPPHLWVPVSAMMSDSEIQDESTLINLLTVLSSAAEYSNSKLIDVVSPLFSDFVIFCLSSSPRVAEQGVDLIAELLELKILQRLIYSQQAAEICGHIPADLARSETRVINGLHHFVTSRPPLEKLVSEYSTKLRDILRTPLRGYPRISSKVKPTIIGSQQLLLNQLEVLDKASESKNTVQQIRLHGAEATRGQLRVKLFAHLAREWDKTLRSYLTVIDPDTASGCEVLMSAPVAGSFVMQFMIESNNSEIIGKAFQELASILAEPEAETDIGTTELLDSETTEYVRRFLSTIDNAHLDVTLISSDPNSLRTFRRRLTRNRIRSAVQYFKESQRTVRGKTTVAIGRLISGSLAVNSFGVEFDDSTISGHFPVSRRETIIDKAIGRKYEFELEESKRKGPSVWTLVDIRPIDLGGKPVKTEVSDEPDESDLRTTDVPQQDRLDRIVSVVRVIASNGYVTPDSLGMPETKSSHRHIDYMKQAARILGLLNHGGAITQSGSEACRLDGEKLTRYLTFRFEQSKVFRVWSKWSGASNVSDLDGDTAISFLLSRNLSHSMAERRGRTLKKWVAAFASTNSVESTSPLAQ